MSVEGKRKHQGWTGKMEQIRTGILNVVCWGTPCGMKLNRLVQKKGRVGPKCKLKGGYERGKEDNLQKKMSMPNVVWY